MRVSFKKTIRKFKDSFKLDFTYFIHIKHMFNEMDLIKTEVETLILSLFETQFQ